MQLLVSSQFHRIWIPLHHRSPLEAKIAEQCGSCGAEAEHRIFHDGLARANGRKEILEVVITVAVAIGSHIFLECS